MQKTDEVSAAGCAAILDEIIAMLPPNQQGLAGVLATKVSRKLAEMAALMVVMAERIQGAPRRSDSFERWAARALEVVGETPRDDE